MTISAKEVQELRKMSGAGMMECKLALSEADGNVEQAFKLLREKGIAKAEKKSTRDANEGLVGIKVHDNFASIIEVNSETDFVSRNSEFHKFRNWTLKVSEISKFLSFRFLQKIFSHFFQGCSLIFLDLIQVILSSKIRNTGFQSPIHEMLTSRPIPVDGRRNKLDFSHMPYFFRLLGLSGFLRYDF